MYNNKMKLKTPKIIIANETRPDVHYSNYITVVPGTAWGLELYRILS